MSEREAFISCIRANPFDLTARLVFADWLDEHGEPREAEIQRWMARTEWQGMEQHTKSAPLLDALSDVLGYQYDAKPQTVFVLKLPPGELPEWMLDCLGRKLFCRWVDRLNGHQVAGYAALTNVEGNPDTQLHTLRATADTADLVFATS